MRRRGHYAMKGVRRVMAKRSYRKGDLADRPERDQESWEARVHRQETAREMAENFFKKNIEQN